MVSLLFSVFLLWTTIAFKHRYHNPRLIVRSKAHRLHQAPLAFKHRYHSPRLIVRSKGHRLHQAPLASRHDIHKAYAAKQRDYDILLEQEEIAELYDNYNNYDKYYDEYFAEMSGATVADIIGAAHGKIKSGAANQIFKASENVSPPFITVKWPGKTKYKWPFKWHDYETAIDNGMLNEITEAIYLEGGLRKETEMELLKYAAKECAVFESILKFKKDCLVDLGSKTAKSDLDFTFIWWAEPSKVVCMMATFYSKFFEIYGEWPLEVYDMNLYIANGFIREKCKKATVDIDVSWKALVEQMFTKIVDDKDDDKPLWELGSPTGYKNKLYILHDNYMAFKFVDRRLLLGTLDEVDPEEKLLRLTYYSQIFYWYLDQIKNKKVVISGDNRDRAVLFLKTLLYGMNYWSDESYVTNGALQLIFNKAVKDMTEDQKYMAVLDCTAFIKRYYMESLDPKTSVAEKDADLWFWNKASKYQFRNGKLLQETTVFQNDFSKVDTADPTRVFPDAAVHFYKKNHPSPKKFDENNLVKANYQALAEQWAGEWNGEDGRVKVDLIGKKKIRGDVPLDWIDDTTKKIWNDVYDGWYKTLMEVTDLNSRVSNPEKLRMVQKIPDCNKSNLKEAIKELRIKLEWKNDYTHDDFFKGNDDGRKLAPMFVRGRKIWDHMKKNNKRLKDRKVVWAHLDTWSNTIKNKILLSKEKKNHKDALDEIYELLNIPKKGGGEIIKWATANVIETPRKDDRVVKKPKIPGKKKLSYHLKQQREKTDKPKKKPKLVNVVDELLTARKLNPFNQAKYFNILEKPG